MKLKFYLIDIGLFMLSNCNVELKRLVYVDKVAKNKETIATYSGYITALNEESRYMEEWKFWKLFKLSIQTLTEIKEADEIVIDWTSYSVRWVAYRHCWGLSLTTIILELWL